jgi:hypothetical protein
MFAPLEVIIPHDSRLKRIEGQLGPLYNTLYIPKDVEFYETIIGGSFPVKVDPGNKHFFSSSDAVYDITGSTLISGCGNTHRFGETAKLILPSTVQVIKERSFKNSRRLSSILFPQDSLLRIIETEAFSECHFLKSILIPKTVEIICPLAFIGNVSLSVVDFEEDSELREIGESAFADTMIETIDIPSKVRIIGARCFANCPKLTQVYWAREQVIEIGEDAFEGCDSLKIT